MKSEQPTEKSTTAHNEEQILEFWESNNIFQKSIDKEAPKGSFTFYDGPPFATGLPHYGHLLAGTIKDIIPRYKTMQGYHVPRVWGWDCHGLPIENLIEKELGLGNKKDIEDYGIEKFNQAARDSVLRYEIDWKRYVPRSGRWIDMEHPYMSMQSSYMESVWWIFSQLYTKGLTKEGFKPMHVCPRCETTLANFEVNQGYKDVTDISVTAQFELIDEPGTYVLAWTTTPWTLPGNVALAVGADIEYVKVSHENAQYVCAKELLEKVFGEKDFEILETFQGSDLVGTSYKPVFDFYQEQTDLENREHGWKIYAADFVTTEDGTGIVHVAPGYGSDDMELGIAHHLPFVQHVGKNGIFKDDFANTVDGHSFQGMMVKQKDDLMSIDIEIIKKLAHDGALFSKLKLVHSYPHCWRCDTPLLNYATSSWYVDVPQLKEKLIAANTQVNWMPEHVGEGRFGKWLEGVRDWALSRSRFWGTPLPIWQNEDAQEVVVMDSVEMLLDHVQRSGNSYIGFRHGQSQSNVDGVVNSQLGVENPLTELGREQVQQAATELHDIDYIFVSPFQRTQETAEIIKNELGLLDDQVIVDDRLCENGLGAEWEGKTWKEYHAFKYPDDIPYIDGRVADDAESIRDFYQRSMEFMFDIESRYQNKNILIVSHGAVLRGLQFGIELHGDVLQAEEYFEEHHNPKNAIPLDLDFVPFPHNEKYELDLHRPYIDTIEVVSKNGNKLSRIEDVFDVWFDSGSMPYAQIHYPFENQDQFLESRFPAQFIAEGLDQTRGWFYVLSVLGMALFDQIPFENVIVNGLILAEDGKKMSKKLQNYPDPYALFNSVGADAVRLYMIASPVVRGEEFAFSEKGVREVGNKVMGRLRNILSLFEMYNDDVDGFVSQDGEQHVLDQWIVARLWQTHGQISTSLDAYELDKAARPIFDFVDDFSTWYIRRSRDRFKGEDAEDKKQALGTTRKVLIECAKMIAPFTPFIAEELWQKLRAGDMPESVHLAEWSDNLISKDAEEVLAKMAQVRELVSQALQLRSQAKIKVRQPLASVTLPISKIDDVYSDVICDELNVKEVKYSTELKIDTELTDELVAEGNMRELLRAIQNLRKDSGLDAHDMVKLVVQTDQFGKDLIDRFDNEIKKTAGISEFVWKECEGVEVKLGDLHFTICVL